MVLAHFPNTTVIDENTSSTTTTTMSTSTTTSTTAIGDPLRKRKDPKEKDPKEKEVKPEESVPEIRVFGDESEPRGGHRCGSVHIPPITCPSGKCPQGYPRYKRPCDGPGLKGKFKCRAMCGKGFRVADGTPRKMKCLGKLGTPGQWKVRPKTFGHVVECVKRNY